MEFFAQRLKELRKSRKKTQREMAEYLGIGLRAYQYYERNEREPQLSVLVRIADYFGISLDELAGRDDSAPGKKEAIR